MLATVSSSFSDFSLLRLFRSHHFQGMKTKCQEIFTARKLTQGVPCWCFHLRPQNSRVSVFLSLGDSPLTPEQQLCDGCIMGAKVGWDVYVSFQKRRLHVPLTDMSQISFLGRTICALIHLFLNSLSFKFTQAQTQVLPREKKSTVQ